jgi:hypothetical protein
MTTARRLFTFCGGSPEGVVNPDFAQLSDKEKAAQMANHASRRTTLPPARGEFGLDEVETIRV